MTSRNRKRVSAHHVWLFVCFHSDAVTGAVNEIFTESCLFNNCSCCAVDVLACSTNNTGSNTSSLRGKPLPKGFIAFGEVGLAGEVRPAPRGQERLKEAAKLGFSVALIPKANAPKKPIEGMTVHAVERVEEAMAVVRG